jgi:ATP-dependent Clp endopeptidase proteolytic subunit ClpP
MRYLIDVDPRVKIAEPEKSLEMPIYITFSGAFTEESAKKFREEIETCELHAIKSKQNIIPIIIDSYGGSVYSLLSMIDAIKSCKIPVATIVEGKAMSCGAVLFTCGAEGHRYMGPNATVMIHDVSSFAMGKEPEIKATAEEVKRLNKLIYGTMAKNCGYDDVDHFYDIVTEKRGADWFIPAEEALKQKIANHITLPKMEVSVKFDWKFTV